MIVILETENTSEKMGSNFTFKSLLYHHFVNFYNVVILLNTLNLWYVF